MGKCETCGIELMHCERCERIGEIVSRSIREQEYKWKCGCWTDGEGKYGVCGIPHGNAITELLNEEEERFRL